LRRKEKRPRAPQFEAVLLHRCARKQIRRSAPLPPPRSPPPYPPLHLLLLFLLFQLALLSLFLSLSLSLRSWMHYALLGSSTSLRRAQCDGTTLKTQKRKTRRRRTDVYRPPSSGYRTQRERRKHTRGTHARARAQVLREPTHRIIAHVRETTVAAATTTATRGLYAFTCREIERVYTICRNARSACVPSPSSLGTRLFQSYPRCPLGDRPVSLLLSALPLTILTPQPPPYVVPL